MKQHSLPVKAYPWGTIVNAETHYRVTAFPISKRTENAIIFTTTTMLIPILMLSIFWPFVTGINSNVGLIIGGVALLLVLTPSILIQRRMSRDSIIVEIFKDDMSARTVEFVNFVQSLTSRDSKNPSIQEIQNAFAAYRNEEQAEKETVHTAYRRNRSMSSDAPSFKHQLWVNEAQRKEDDVKLLQ